MKEAGIEDVGGSNSTAFRMGGNPRWQAPELLDNEMQDPTRTKESDIFALGRVMLEVRIFI